VTDSFKELVKTLKGRFDGANQSDKFRIEIRNRRRKDGESLQSLHSDVRRLAALAFPDLQHSARETIACDYFIDALADADFALKVREREPTNLDSALRTALQLEVWSKQVERTTPYKKIREVTKTDDETTALKKQVAELQKQLAKLSQQMPKTTPPVAEQPTGRASARKPQQTKRDFACFNCGDPNHAVRYCPYPPTTAPPMPTNVVEPTQPMRRTDHRVQPIRNQLVPSSISVRFKKHRLSALIDTGSKITIASADFAKKYR